MINNLIIGAGITGLSFASFYRDENYLIIEQDHDIGGYCKTIKQDGFTWDYSGHFFHFRNNSIKKYLMENMDLNLIKDVSRKAQIYYKNRYIDFPFQKNIHQLSKKDFIDCIYDLFFPEDSSSGSFKQMLFSKYGKSIANMFLVPYNEKLYACDLDDLDKDSMGRFFPHANIKDIVYNIKHPENNSYNSMFTYSKGGAIEYANSIFKRLNPSKISLNEKLEAIDLSRKTAITNKREIRFNNLISTIPFPKLLDIAKIEFDKKIYSWNQVLVFNLGFDSKGSDRNNIWVYFPEKKYHFYRVGYYDNIFNDNKMSLYVEIGFNNKTNINVKKSLKKVLDDLKNAGILQDQKLISSHSAILNPAYVHINQRSEQDKSEKKNFLKQFNIYSIGRYGDWKYCSIEDNIIEAKELANSI